ncbi:hypothetical protein Agub_g1612, partial [Astrephomene gubernaculifera]
ARVSLARVCYARPAVALLDDPLSAVDPRVGWELFKRAIGPDGLLASCGATRILATHQRQYLPLCDQLLVLRRGRLAALGPWRQVAALQLPELTGGFGGAAAAGAGAGLQQKAASAADLTAPIHGEPLQQQQQQRLSEGAVGQGGLEEDALVPAAGGEGARDGDWREQQEA